MPSPVPSPARTMTFGGLVILYSDEVLEPRPWTLAQSEWAADLQQDAPRGAVLELFAGVGQIGLAATAASGRDLVLVDLNPAACELAHANAATAGASHRVVVRHGRVDEAVGHNETFPVIIADPPWVPSDGVQVYPDDPTIAIDGGHDGLDLARTCCAVIDAHLAPGGAAVLQLGTTEQAEAVVMYLDKHLSSDLVVIGLRFFERGVLLGLGR